MKIKHLLFALCGLLLPIVTQAVEIDDRGYFKATIGDVTCTFQVVDANAMTCRLYNDWDLAAEGSGTFTLPATVEGYTVVGIGGGAFYECDFAEVDLSNVSISEIPSSCFEGSYELVKITLPGSVKKIGDRAIRDCTRLETINMPEGIERIGDYAFYGVGSENTYTNDDDWDVAYPFDIYIPSAVATIGKEAFKGVRLGTVTCNIRIPFQVSNDVFTGKDDAKLIVHTGLGFQFEAAGGWEFDTIEEQDLGDAIDISKPLSEILTDGVNGETYQIRDELIVADQWVTSRTTTAMATVTTYTYYMILTDGEGTFIRLVIPQDKYKDLDGVYSIAGRSITGILRNKGANPYFEVLSIPVEGDSEEEYEIRDVSLVNNVAALPNEPVTAQAFIGRDGKAYAGTEMTGKSWVLDKTYLTDQLLVKGVTYDMKAWAGVSGSDVTLYPYAMTPNNDIAKVEYSTSLANLLANGTDGESYIISDKLYVVYKNTVQEDTSYLFVNKVNKDAVFATDGNGNWIVLHMTNNSYKTANNVIRANSLEGILRNKDINPYLSVYSTNLYYGDNEDFTGFKTYDLNEPFAAQPNEVFLASGYALGEEGDVTFAAQTEGANQSFAAAMDVTPNVNQDYQYFLYPGYHYNIKAIAMPIVEDGVNTGGFTFSVLKDTYIFDDYMVVFKSHDANGAGSFSATDKNNNAQNTNRQKFYDEIERGRDLITFATCTKVSPGYQGLKIYTGGNFEVTLDRTYKAKAIRVVACKYSEHKNYDGATLTVGDSTVTLGSRKFVEYTVNMPAGTEIDKVKIGGAKGCYVMAFSIDENSALPGDVNGDGTIDVTDVNILINIILGNEQNTTAGCDLNGDGAVDVTDVNQIINLILNK